VVGESLVKLKVFNKGYFSLTDLKQTRIKTDISEHLPTAQSLVKLKVFRSISPSAWQT